MNDFTKEELNLLIHYIGLTLDKAGLDLAVKIQYLIDNYCDHKNTYEDLDYNPTRCKDCKEIVE